MAEVGRTPARPGGNGAVRVRGMDAEGLRLGLPAVHSGASGWLRGGHRSALREHPHPRKSAGLLRAAEVELFGEVLQPGSAGSLPERKLRRGLQFVFEGAELPGAGNRSGAAAVVDARLQRRSDVVAGGAEERRGNTRLR